MNNRVIFYILAGVLAVLVLVVGLQIHSSSTTGIDLDLHSTASAD